MVVGLSLLYFIVILMLDAIFQTNLNMLCRPVLHDNFIWHLQGTLLCCDSIFLRHYAGKC